MSGWRTRYYIDGQGDEYPADVEHIVDVIIGTPQQRSQDVWDGLLKDILEVQCMVKAINHVE